MWCLNMMFRCTQKLQFFIYDLFEHKKSFNHHSMPEHSKTLYKDVKKLFKYDKNLIITKGNLPDTLKISSPQKIAFFHLDLNDVEAEISTLELLFDRMVPSAILVLDDFGWLGYKNQCDQEKQWFEKKGYKVLEMPTGQGMVIKT
mgnify:CR=1 FL=1